MPRLFRELSNRDIALIVLPLAVLLVLAIWGITYYVQPAPPKVVVMSTGPLDGAYHAFALRYRRTLPNTVSRSSSGPRPARSRTSIGSWPAKTASQWRWCRAGSRTPRMRRGS